MEKIMNDAAIVEAAIKAQQDYCKDIAKCNKENGISDWMNDSFEKGMGFAPMNGRCYACKKIIYLDYPKILWNGDKGVSKGISIEKASSELITGCPHCHRSFCD